METERTPTRSMQDDGKHSAVSFVSASRVVRTTRGLAVTFGRLEGTPSGKVYPA
jgi:hypothetical protein